MRGAKKLLLATVLALLLATGFAACGGEGSDDSTAGSAPSTAQETTATTPPAEDRVSAKGENEPGDVRDGGSAKGPDDAAAPSEHSGGSNDSTDSDDPPSSGDSSSSSPSSGGGSGAFRTPGGDNSVQNFGEEADAAEVEAATTVLAGYMQARANDDWSKQCRCLAAATLKPIEQLSSRAPQLKGKGCPELLSALTGTAPA